jgi:acetyl-CoA carboxylase biotin carboxyl carrier protein
MEIKDLEQIINILKQNDVTDFELHQGDTHIRLSRALRQAPGALVSMQNAVIEPAIGQPTSDMEQAEGGISSKPSLENPGFVKVESPLVGTFYRRPAPDAEPFAKEGDSISKGDTLCIVEAMKLMNEIEAPVSGRIEKILVEDGHVVEYGEVLFLINPAV